MWVISVLSSAFRTSFLCFINPPHWAVAKAVSQLQISSSVFCLVMQNQDSLNQTSASPAAPCWVLPKETTRLEDWKGALSCPVWPLRQWASLKQPSSPREQYLILVLALVPVCSFCNTCTAGLTAPLRDTVSTSQPASPPDVWVPTQRDPSSKDLSFNKSNFFLCFSNPTGGPHFLQLLLYDTYVGFFCQQFLIPS